MTVSGKLGIYRTAEIEPVNKRGGTQINKSADLIGDNILVNLCRSEGIDPDRDRLGNTDGIRDLNLAPVGKPGGNDVLCYVPRGICGSPVNLRRVLPGEGSAAVTGIPAVGINDYLPPVSPSRSSAGTVVPITSRIISALIVSSDTSGSCCDEITTVSTLTGLSSSYSTVT